MYLYSLSNNPSVFCLVQIKAQIAYSLWYIDVSLQHIHVQSEFMAFFHISSHLNHSLDVVGCADPKHQFLSELFRDCLFLCQLTPW